MSATNERLIKDYVKNAAMRRWSDSQIKALTPKLRAELSKYAEKDGKPIGRVHPELKAMIESRGFTPADAGYALSLVQEKSINPMIQSNSEWIASKGGNEVFTQDLSVLHMHNGEKLKRVLTPIPTNPSNPDKYDNLDAVTAFCGTLVSHTDGVWANANEQVWVKAFPMLSAEGTRQLACFVASVLNADPQWAAMTLTSRASITGRNGAVFIRDAFNSLTRPIYNYLNTKIVINAFGTLVKAPDGGWEYSVDEEGKDAVPAKVYEAIPKTREDEEFSDEYPATCWYRGGWIPKGRMGKVDYSQTASVLAARQRAVDVARGDACIPTLLAKSQGFSGMTTDAAKRQYWIIGQTLESWRRGRVVDIRLTTDGDIRPLYCSLTYWKDRIVADWAKDKETIFDAMKDKEGSWFYFMSAKRNAHLNVSAEMKELLIHKHHELAVAVTFLDDSIKTKVERAADPVNHDVASAFVLPPDLPTDFIVKCPIYGTAFFPKDDSLSRIKKKSTESKVIGKQYSNVVVYAHGNAMDFFGVASTLQDLCIVGASSEKDQFKMVTIPLKMYVSREEWYTRVAQDVLAIYQAVFSPKKTYSPISNLLVITKGKVSILADLNDGTSSAYSGRVFARAGQGRKKFALPGSAPTSTAMPAPQIDTQTSRIEAAVAEKDPKVVTADKDPTSSSSSTGLLPPAVEKKPFVMKSPIEQPFYAQYIPPPPQEKEESEEEVENSQDEDGESAESEEDLTDINPVGDDD
jgi:hypothetical protein